jgi:hypothetical protein
VNETEIESTKKELDKLIQDDLTRPYCRLMQGYKQDAEAYERALKEIRKITCAFFMDDSDIQLRFIPCNIDKIASAALRGDYHKK